jgi:hypothetical protein
MQDFKKTDQLDHTLYFYGFLIKPILLDSIILLTLGV